MGKVLLIALLLVGCGDPRSWALPGDRMALAAADGYCNARFAIAQDTASRYDCAYTLGRSTLGWNTKDDR